MSLLKMIKHSQDGMPATVEGLLLGLDVGTNLEVTNVLPFPQSAGGGDEGDSRQQEDEARYQGEMLRLLRAVNLDANVVGWYKSAFIGSGISPEVLQQQFDTQEDLGPNALMLLIDPYRAAEGTLAVRAYRLTDLFMARYAATMGQMGHEEMVKSEIASSSVFEEVPVRLRNTALAECYLQQLSAASAAQAAGSGSELSRLFVSSSSMLEKNMEKLCEQVDELKKEQRTFRKFERDIKSQEREKNEWLNQRRVDNATRERQGKPLLDAEDPTHPAFQRIAEPECVAFCVLLRAHSISPPPCARASGSARRHPSLSHTHTHAHALSLSLPPQPLEERSYCGADRHFLRRSRSRLWRGALQALPRGRAAEEQQLSRARGEADARCR
jgi:translation initiation factor 3 subunit H